MMINVWYMDFLDKIGIILMDWMDGLDGWMDWIQKVSLFVV